jgi:hypothetical protein
MPPELPASLENSSLSLNGSSVEPSIDDSPVWPLAFVPVLSSVTRWAGSETSRLTRVR